MGVSVPHARSSRHAVAALPSFPVFPQHCDEINGAHLAFLFVGEGEGEKEEEEDEEEEGRKEEMAQFALGGS